MIGEEPFDATNHVRDVVSVIFSEMTVVSVIARIDPDLNLSTCQIVVHASAHKLTNPVCKVFEELNEN